VFDTAIKTNVEKICNVAFGEENWSQASLPIRHAGLGLRSAADLSLSCSVPSKIFVSQPVFIKCHQDQKKLRRPW